jgi:hypothetical protein
MQGETAKIDLSSIFLIIFIGIIFITTVSTVTIQNFVNNWHTKSILIIVLTCLHTFRTVSYILPVLAIKNKTYKIIGFILYSITVIYLLISPLRTYLSLLRELIPSY